MLGKLIKYEMKSVLRVLIPVYIGLIALSVWMKIILTIDSKNASLEIISVISEISVLAYLFMILATGIITLIIIIKRFYKSVLCDEGYLTNTLPVKSETIIIAKMLAALLWVIISIFITFLSSIILTADINPAKNEEVMKTMGLLAFFGIGTDQSSTRMGMVVADLLCIVSQILHLYAAIGLGHLLSKHRVLGAFAAFIALGVVFSIIKGIFSTEFSVDTAMYMMSMNNMSLFSSSALIFRSISYTVQGVVYFVITNYVLSKRLNLE